MENYEKAKAWFQNATESDLELMISMGAITKEVVIEMYLEEIKVIDLEAIYKEVNSQLDKDSFDNRIILTLAEWNALQENIEKLKKTEKLERLNEMLKLQGDNGSWNYDPYMHGMYNGMEFMVSMLEDREPEFREAPSEWLANKPSFPPIASEAAQP